MPTPISNGGSSVAAGYEDYETNQSVGVEAEHPTCNADGAYDDAPEIDDATSGTRVLVGKYDEAKAQAGHAAELATAGGGCEGAGSGPHEPSTPVADRPGGGTVLALEGGGTLGGAAAGVSVGVVWDEECGPGVIASFNYGASLPALRTPEVAGLAGIASYDGSFENFDNSTQLAVSAGDGSAASVRVYVDDDGNVIGEGVAAGVGLGVSATATHAKTLSYFTECD